MNWKTINSTKINSITSPGVWKINKWFNIMHTPHSRQSPEEESSKPLGGFNKVRALALHQRHTQPCRFNLTQEEDNFPVYHDISKCGKAVTGPRLVTVEQGSSLSVSCSYKPRYKLSSKYWCLKSSLWYCLTYIVRTNGSEATVTRDRVSIRDNHTANSFTVTLSSVTPGDAGQYSCGVKKKLGINHQHRIKVMVSTVMEVVPEAKEEAKPRRHSEEEQQGFPDVYMRLLLVLASALPVTGPCTVQRALRETLSVTCKYQPGRETLPKFWCKPSISAGATYIVSTSKWQPEVRQGWFSILDNCVCQAFRVTVEYLAKEDAGMFLCGMRKGFFPLHERADVEVIKTPGRSLNVSPIPTVITTSGDRARLRDRNTVPVWHPLRPSFLRICNPDALAGRSSGDRLRFPPLPSAGRAAAAGAAGHEHGRALGQPAGPHGPGRRRSTPGWPGPDGTGGARAAPEPRRALPASPAGSNQRSRAPLPSSLRRAVPGIPALLPVGVTVPQGRAGPGSAERNR
ncbi:hypothetical protein DUI87_31401 [Hirundo rustica rustica]|uniref:Ig-like domain-containing protein n=1 Tax=Hirundo rustica rustica TaxID=333673 RepID=A0A3M0J0I9_HIRRU|nr:hypothetical protein DUI87_31401 [Hirundo rustica rustica]